jgi:N-acetylneuraminate synthase
VSAEVVIGGHVVGNGHPCFIIAEAGVNHNGDLGLALQLVDAAITAGADAVKFQTWITSKLVVDHAPLAEYQAKSSLGNSSQFGLLEALELSFDEFRDIKAYADKRGILFLSTPDEEESADFLQTLGVVAYKVGSAEITTLPYLRHIARKRRPIILSTGMATHAEVAAAVAAVRATGNDSIALLHCVSAYPAPAAHCNLRAMETLERDFDCPVGFSDHTQGVNVALAAVARGAAVLEKHMTLDRGLAGPDHRASLEPAEFAAMVKAIREVESALGDGIKRPMESEIETRSIVRKRVVAAREMPAGHLIEMGDIALRRASAGLGAEASEFVIGRKLRSPVAASSPIEKDMLE